MTKKKVHIISIQETYLESISKQVKEVLGDKITIQSTTLKDLQSNTVKPGEIVLLSHDKIKGIVSQLIPKDCSCFVAKRDINFANTKELLNLPSGQKILVVNDTKLNTNETVESLRETIFEHQYIPYSPDEPIPDSVDYIVTPGERDLLPSSLPNVIDIGSRLLNLETFVTLLSYLEMEEYNSSMLRRYVKSLISQSTPNQKAEQTEKVSISKDIRNIAQYTFEDIVAVSKLMKETLEQARGLANIDHPIFIQGEDGTGKNMLAQALHNESNHADRPFISINCLSRDVDIIEKELFGFEDGGSISIGFLELAKDGTICIEGVDDFPLPLQVRLLSAIQKKSFYRLGGSRPIPFKARLITTSTKDMKELALKGKFHNELCYLLTSFLIYMPPLCERKEDFIPLIEDIKARLKRPDLTFSDEVMGIFINYEWSGNIKDLYNVISYLSALAEPIISLQSLPLSMRSSEKSEGFDTFIQSKMNAEEIIKKIEAHGFLEESIEILLAFEEGKKNREAYGRLKIKQTLEKQEIYLSEQQLRMRIEVLRELGLLIVRQGRAGSTISSKGEDFLRYISLENANEVIS
ncbi:sigma-54-dependent Fis family transcriptional regulator [Cytobacillus depressus]|uniref:Sigma-54-dependent Fis family transcriptional regulator n=1 Tax=Cytobacillus depressus TaxID=1602942 RepID=A0A6L3V5V9_9BACI|nr:sigma 54-interacting transcriptional regulator [Cytobacillus depressus]KAB2336626.1 sigma-54-dependent Fis family transcriptional regulator [Cytobacillus depressus]